MDSSVNGDGTKDIAISEGPATQWKLDLVALGWVLMGGLARRSKREP
jgi:hypothetical protein